MIAILLTPSVLSALILAAHFLRNGQMLPLLGCLVAAALPAVRHPRARRALQFFLLLGTMEWVRTGMELVSQRQAAGEPWERMVAILGAVAGVALLGLVLLGTPRVRAHFAPPR